MTRPAPNRLLELADAASQNAALSSRLELYPHGMAADRALRLALGALAGAHTLTEAEVRSRVAGRYPDAARLPERPDLDALLRDAGSELRSEPDAAGGQGACRSPLRQFVTVGSATSYTRAASGASRVGETGTAKWGDADAFEQRLRRALENRAFLALTVSPRRLGDAERALAAAFAVDARSADELLIRHMKAAAHEAGADWRIVLRADGEPRGGADWTTLIRLVGHRALPRVRAELAAAPRAVLLTNLGLLARYDQMAFLDLARHRGPGERSAGRLVARSFRCAGVPSAVNTGTGLPSATAGCLPTVSSSRRARTRSSVGSSWSSSIWWPTARPGRSVRGPSRRTVRC